MTGLGETSEMEAKLSMVIAAALTGLPPPSKKE